MAQFVWGLLIMDKKIIDAQHQVGAGDFLDENISDTCNFTQSAVEHLVHLNRPFVSAVCTNAVSIISSLLNQRSS